MPKHPRHKRRGHTAAIGRSVSSDNILSTLPVTIPSTADAPPLREDGAFGTEMERVVSDEGSPPAQHSPAPCPPAQHSAAQFSPAQSSPAQYSPVQYSPAQYSPVQYSPAQYSSTQPSQRPLAQDSPAQSLLAELPPAQRPFAQGAGGAAASGGDAPVSDGPIDTLASSVALAQRVINIVDSVAIPSTGRYAPVAAALRQNAMTVPATPSGALPRAQPERAPGNMAQSVSQPIAIGPGNYTVTFNTSQGPSSNIQFSVESTAAPTAQNSYPQNSYPQNSHLQNSYPQNSYLQNSYPQNSYPQVGAATAGSSGTPAAAAAYYRRQLTIPRYQGESDAMYAVRFAREQAAYYAWYFG